MFLLHASLEETMSPHSAFRALSQSFSFSKTQAFENQKGCLQAVSFPKGFKQLFWNSKIQAMTPLFCLQQTLLLYDPRFKVSLCLMLPEWKTWEFPKRRDRDSKTLFCFPVAIAWNSVPFRVPVLSNGLTAFLHSFPMHFEFWLLLISLLRIPKGTSHLAGEHHGCALTAPSCPKCPLFLPASSL